MFDKILNNSAISRIATGKEKGNYIPLWLSKAIADELLPLIKDWFIKKLKERETNSEAVRKAKLVILENKRKNK